MKLKDLLAILSHVEDDEEIETKEEPKEEPKILDKEPKEEPKILDDKDKLIAILKDKIANKENIINEQNETIRGLKAVAMEDPKESEYTLNELIERNEF